MLRVGWRRERSVKCGELVQIGEACRCIYSEQPSSTPECIAYKTILSIVLTDGVEESGGSGTRPADYAIGM